MAEAAAAHIHAVAARIRLVNQQPKTAYRQLDQLCDRLVPPEDNAPGERCEQHDVAILRSMPGLGRIILAVLLPTGDVWMAPGSQGLFACRQGKVACSHMSGL